MSSSIHIQGASSGSLEHNLRDNFSYSVVFFDEENEYQNNSKTANSIYLQELAKRSEEYTKNTNQKLQSKAITHLSAIVNLKKEHTLKDLEAIKLHLENSLDTKVFQMSIHRDEGKLKHKETGDYLVSGEDFFYSPKKQAHYYDKKCTQKLDLNDYEIEKNYHAHIEFMGIDSNGNGIKRNKLNRYYLMELQSLVATSLNMERGIKKEVYSLEQRAEINALLKPKNEYSNIKEYYKDFDKKAKELGCYIEKKPSNRLDTHEFKASKKQDNIKAKAVREKKEQIVKLANDKIKEKNITIKELKESIKELRVELQENKASRPEYARLEAFNKSLELQVKNKNLTNSELQLQVSNLRNELFKRDETIALLNNSRDSIKEDLNQVVAKYQNTIEQVKRLIEELDNHASESEKIMHLTKESLNLENSPEDRLKFWEEATHKMQEMTSKATKQENRIIVLEKEKNELQGKYEALNTAYISTTTNEKIIKVLESRLKSHKADYMSMEKMNNSFSVKITNPEKLELKYIQLLSGELERYTNISVSELTNTMKLGKQSSNSLDELSKNLKDNFNNSAHQREDYRTI